MVATLRNADPKLKAEVYAELGVEVTPTTPTSEWCTRAQDQPVYNRVCRRGWCRRADLTILRLASTALGYPSCDPWRLSRPIGNAAVSGNESLSLRRGVAS